MRREKRSRFAPGAQLPSTAYLVDEFGVSNTTVQKALSVLKGEGYLTSRQGKGVFVRERQPFRVEADTYFEPTPGGYSYELLEVAEVASPTEVARALGLEAGDPVQLRHRLLRHGGRPVEVDWSYYPLELARGTGLAEQRRIRGGAPRVLEELGSPQRAPPERAAHDSRSSVVARPRVFSHVEDGDALVLGALGFFDQPVEIIRVAGE
ncbi:MULTISPECIES: GntR family transcriptional regulator [unclassified Spirillospora]|uniref:GntR family transcriptional regulator n=1 Tax=unclassified Spirillospora TaxID=2642701 RepID=UPI003717E06C